MGSFFGSSVAVDGNWIILGAREDDNINGMDAGAVFLFTKTSSSSSTWTQMTQLWAANGADNDSFGTSFGKSVSISKDASTIAVGAFESDFSTFSGAAFMFRMIDSSPTTAMTTMEWTQMGKFVAADRNTYYSGGSSIAIENNIVVVGAPEHDSTSGIENAGYVYFLDTGFSSSPTTIAPTAEPFATPTPKPTTLSLTPKPTNLPTTMVPSPNNGSATQLPTTNSPISVVLLTPPAATTSPSPNGIDDYNNTTIQQQPTQPPDDDSGFVLSTGAIVGVLAIFVVGVVAIVIAFLNYRFKLLREAREQQQQQAMNTGDPLTPIMADVVLEPPASQPVDDGTIEAAGAFLDPTSAFVAQIPPAHVIANPLGEKLPQFKDQVRTVKPNGRSTNTALSALEPKRNSQQQEQHQADEEKEEETVEDQVSPVQQQQLHPDPPTSN
jgi:hypothetical protein